MSKKNTLEDAKMLAAKNNGLCLSTEYINCREKLQWQCSEGHIWSTKYSHIQQGHWCPECTGHGKITLEKISILEKKNNGKCLSTSVSDAHEKLLWQCENGHIWANNYNGIQQGKWCPECKGGIKKSLEYIKSFIENLGGELQSKEYDNRFTLLTIKCNKGHIWQTTYTNLKKGSWCTSCRWKNQEKLYNILSELFSSCVIKRNFRKFKWLKNKKSLEIDFYIPELKLAIEYNGQMHYFPVDYFGGEDAYKKIVNRDIIKKKLIEDNYQDVRHYIIFTYKDILTAENVKNKIGEIINVY